MIETKSDVNGPLYSMVLSEEVTFLNKGSIVETLRKFPKNTRLIIDGSKCRSIDYDILEVIREFREYTAREKNITLITISIPEIQDKTSSH